MRQTFDTLIYLVQTFIKSLNLSAVTLDAEGSSLIHLDVFCFWDCVLLL
jgi:hypothetical protein